MIFFLFSMRKYELYDLKQLQKLRLRISRDLHDDLRSALTGIGIRSELIMDKKDSKKVNEFLNDIAVQSRSAVDTLSDIVWAMDSRNNKLQNLADRMHNVLYLLLTPLDISFQFTSIEEIIKDNPNYKFFKAVETKNVYSFSTKKGKTGGVIYYELAPNRPDLVLKDIIKILHPEVLPNYELFFFERLE